MKLNIINKEFANNQDVDDFLVTSGRVIPKLSGYIYEHKITLRTIKDIENLIINKSYPDIIKKAIKDCKVGYATCRFDFGDLIHIPIDLQEKLLHFQEKIFNDVTIQLIGNNFNDFQDLFIYAKTNIKLPMASLVDTKIPRRDIENSLIIIGSSDIDYTKWIYGKFTTHLLKYITIRNKMKEIGKPYLLIGCDKRCGIEQYRNIAVSTIAMKHFGFYGCCRDYIDTSNRKKKGFPLDGTDTFDKTKWEWTKRFTKDYRLVRQNNFNDLNRELNNITQQAINQRPQFGKLLRHLSQLETQLSS